MIVNNNPYPLTFYPASLSQLSTIGYIHNHAPIPSKKLIAGVPDKKDYHMKLYRFYFDGLIVHFNVLKPSVRKKFVKDVGNLMVAQRKDLLISTIDYDKSFQKEQLEELESYGVFQITFESQ